jgi:hypothetical protein
MYAVRHTVTVSDGSTVESGIGRVVPKVSGCAMCLSSRSSGTSPYTDTVTPRRFTVRK